MCKLFSGKINLSASKIISISISESWNACFLPVQAKNTFERKNQCMNSPAKLSLNNSTHVQLDGFWLFLTITLFFVESSHFLFLKTTVIISGWGRCWGSCRGCCLNLSNGTLQKWKICKNGKFEKMENLQKWKISSKSNCFLPWLSVLVSFNIPLKLSFKLKMLKKNCYKYVDGEEEKPRWLEINCFVRLTYDTL